MRRVRSTKYVYAFEYCRFDESGLPTRIGQGSPQKTTYSGLSSTMVHAVCSLHRSSAACMSLRHVLIVDQELHQVQLYVEGCDEEEHRVLGAVLRLGIDQVVDVCDARLLHAEL